MTTKDYARIHEVSELADLVARITEEGRPLGFDIETGYEGPPREKAALAMHARGFVTGFSFTDDPRWARYVPLRHDFADNLDPDEVWPVMQPLLEAKRSVAHNAKFEKRYMRTEGIELGVLADTMLQAYVLSEWPSVSLKYLTKEVFDHDQKEIETLFPNAKKKELDALRFNALGVAPEVVSYACEDSVWCLSLHEQFLPRIRADAGLSSIYDVEMEVMEILCDVEDYGVGIDWAQMMLAFERAGEVIFGLEREVKTDLGEALGRSLLGMNLNSTKQLREVLFSEPPHGFGLPVTRVTATEVASTDEITLRNVAKKVDKAGNLLPVAGAIQKLLTMRELSNLHNRMAVWLETPPKRATDIPKFPVRGADDRVHASYAQARVGSGRFSAANPAIQQCPKEWSFSLVDGRSFGGNFRDFIVPTAGKYLLGFDYSQIELRAIAGLAQERALLDAFARGDDVHTLTAAMMLGKPVENVDPKVDRPIGKTMNFALIYQMGPGSLAQRLGLPRDQARDLYDSYFANFPAIGAYVEKAKRDCKNRLLPHTLSYFGRKWTIWELANSTSSHAQFAHGERKAVNGPVQGWAADYMKYAMIRVGRKLRSEDLWPGRVMMTMNQHDALYFEVDDDLDPRDVIRLLRPRVEFPIVGFPDIVSEWELGYRWGSMKALDESTPVERGEDGWYILGETREIERELEVDDVVVSEDFHETGVDMLPEELSEGGVVIIEVSRMPFDEEFHALMRLLVAMPGSDSVIVRTPSGDVTLPVTSRLTPEDGGDVSLALPGARVYRPMTMVDVDDLASAL